jgi:hypothetical protein
VPCILKREANFLFQLLAAKAANGSVEDINMLATYMDLSPAFAHYLQFSNVFLGHLNALPGDKGSNGHRVQVIEASLDGLLSAVICLRYFLKDEHLYHGYHEIFGIQPPTS